MIFNKCLVIGEDCIIANFLNLFQKFGQLLYSSKPAGLNCSASYYSTNVRRILLKQTSNADIERIFSRWVNLIRGCGVNITEEAVLVRMFAMCNNDIMDYKTIDDEELNWLITVHD